MTGINPSCSLGMLLTAFPLAGGSSMAQPLYFLSQQHPHLTQSQPGVVVLDWLSHLSPCSKQNSGFSFSSQLLCLIRFESKFSGQAAFDGAGRLWLYLCLGVLLFQTTRAEFLLQLSSLCPSRCLFVWEPGGEFHLQPYQPYLLLP